MSQPTYDQCLMDGKYTKVTAGESCTIGTAKKLDIFDSDRYFPVDYQETKTFNEEWDSGKKQSAQLCDVLGSDAAYPFCQVEYGPAFTRKSDQADQCIVMECPPNFERDPENEQICKKPQKPYIVMKSKLCEERFYDWYTIPNFYLGNGYKNVDGQCYAPCPYGHLPYYKTDPITGINPYIGGDNQDDVLGRCMNKYYYMLAKYDNTPEFSPLAWIKRLNTNAADIENDWIKEITDKKVSPDLLEDFKKIIREKSKLIYNIHLSSLGNYYEDLFKPGFHYTRIASEEVQDDKYKYVETARELCMSLKENEEKFITSYRSKFPGLSDFELDIRINLMKQACDLCFCSKLALDPICMGAKSRKPFLKMDDIKFMGKSDKQKEQDRIEQNLAKLKGPVDDKILMAVNRGLKTFFIVVFTPAILYLLYLLIKKLLFKKDLLLQFYDEAKKELKKREMAVK